MKDFSLRNILGNILKRDDKKIRDLDDGDKLINLLNNDEIETRAVLTELRYESIINNKGNRLCLIDDLSKLRESSKEAVENLNEFTAFKKYMHIERQVQKELEHLIMESNKSNRAQLILVCGSVGDGKSHIISYFKNRYPNIIENFKLYNDATESLEPDKTSIDTLNEELKDFNDYNINSKNTKLILAINLGTLNNFIDSKYSENFSILKSYIEEKKILEMGIEDNKFDETSSIQYINFSDYHLYSLNNGKVKSEYMEKLINKLTSVNDNYFYNSYKKNCLSCSTSGICPVKANYELLQKSIVKQSIIQLIVRSIIENKIIISTRALINFMYELIVPVAYIDINSVDLKNNISNLNNNDYINSLMPNIIFEHKQLSFIFESLSQLDPLNIRNEDIDNFILEFNNSSNILSYFDTHIDYPENYLLKVCNVDFKETQDNKIKIILLKLFIRSYYICAKSNLFNLEDSIYNEFVKGIYNWNKGNKIELKNLYEDVKNSILKWQGEADEGKINIFIGQNQAKYKISEELELKVDLSNIKQDSNENNIDKFITTLKLKYKSESKGKSYYIDLDFRLYKLLIKVVNGYRPNKKDKSDFINFIEFINKIEDTGSKDKELIFTEKNRSENKRYKLEYDNEFECYRFLEI